MLNMDRNTGEAAAERLDVARGEESAAAKKLETARGTAGEFHADVELRATGREVSARSAWVAWAEEGGDQR